jgi:hypothetical protein
MSMSAFEFPEQLLRVHAVMRAQEDTVRRVASLYADTIDCAAPCLRDFEPNLLVTDKHD